ncbi:hypothetical protein COCMIDRAFT_33969 [Bipolaris oryzae ATCC 44560]|uniref:Uncharacterized protein n=1 Tax=Bipolaris oryzae ATCC 44560 TaxID=930090 RepID=W6ZF22_COCMI|nr:uncharacterized protein COCMIDRAFT_33969 [Bipolaris oryzae ATCC 44560]EUC48483.1 hypothetical protein COCMIDRAFT_33969 [Bipolaris oryzae ATCC 44560]
MSLRHQHPEYTRLGYSILDVSPLKLYDRLIMVLALLPEVSYSSPNVILTNLNCSYGDQHARADITHGIHVIQVISSAPMRVLAVVILRITAAIADLICSSAKATAKPRLPPPNARMDMVSAQIDRVTGQKPKSLLISTQLVRTVTFGYWVFLIYDIQLAEPHVASRHRNRALIHREKPWPADHCTGTDD